MIQQACKWMSDHPLIPLVFAPMLSGPGLSMIFKGDLFIGIPLAILALLPNVIFVIGIIQLILEDRRERRPESLPPR